jgi:hypothetical protein
VNRGADDRLPGWAVAVLSAEPTRPYDAYPLVTVDEDGWPHVALLSWGELLPKGDTHVMLALWPASSTRRNLERTGRAVLDIAGEGGVLHVRLRVENCVPPVETPLAVFSGFVTGARHDVVAYASITHGPRFDLLDERVHDRWLQVRGILEATPVSSQRTR